MTPPDQSHTRIAELEAALKPFAEIQPSSFCAEDGSDGERYAVRLYDGTRHEPPHDFTGADLARARALLKETPMSHTTPEAVAALIEHAKTSAAEIEHLACDPSATRIQDVRALNRATITLQNAADALSRLTAGAGEAERRAGRWLYERAEALMDAKPGTPEGAELNYLANILETLEAGK